MTNASAHFEFKIEPVKIASGRGFVVRDDLLFGGTKQRAITPFLADLQRQGHREFIYASPFSGFAQVALASTVSSLGIKCTLFCERMPDGSVHRFSRLAESLGAVLVLCDSLEEAEASSATYADQGNGRYKIPLGFNQPSYRDC